MRDDGDLRALRARAEQQLQQTTRLELVVPEQGAHVLHELRVHEVELQLQNDALREAQTELQRSSARYRALYDLAPVACLSLGTDSRIAECNRAAAALLGTTGPSELLGRRFSQFLRPEHAELFELHRRAVWHKRVPSSCSLELVTLRGEHLDVLLKSSWTDGPPGAQWFLAVVDFTEINRLLRRAQQAQQLDAMSTLSSGIAHDFRNLLTAAVGCAEEALPLLSPGDPARAPIEQMREVARRGRSIVASAMQFARIGSGPLEPIVLDEALATLERLLARLVGPGVQSELDLGAPGAQILADRGQFDQIVFNLAINARHAMPSGGRLCVVTRVGHGGGRAKELNEDAHGWVLMQVSDTGVGMDEATRRRALEPFFTTKPAGTGTGLGLAVVLGAVTQAGGQVELDSSPGEGTTVSLYWPLCADVRGAHAPSQSRALRSAAPSATPGELGIRRALVVDGDPLVRKTIRRYLEQIGCAASEASDSETALELLSEDRQPLQLLVVDATLRGLGGKALAAAGRALRPGLPVLFVSSYPPQHLVQAARLEPDAFVLYKPFGAEELQAALGRLLGAAREPRKPPPARLH